MNRVEEKLLHPPPGSRIEAARAYGIDLTLLVERLRRTPKERVHRYFMLETNRLTAPHARRESARSTASHRRVSSDAQSGAP